MLGVGVCTVTIRYLPAREIGPGHIFIIFYTVALLADVDDIITRPSGWVIAAISLWVFMAVSRLSFLTLLLATTFQFVVYELPDTENHTNLLVFTNAAMILCMLVSYARERRDGVGTFFSIAQPVARLSIIAALFAAGLHKLNYDFIDPTVSCIRQFSGDIAAAMAGDFSGHGVPTLAVLGAMVAVMGLLLLRRPAEISLPPLDWSGFLPPLGVILAGMAVLAVLTGGISTFGPGDYFIFALAVAVLSWQLVEAPLLLLPRFQWFALCFSLVVHAQLALLRIVDFQAIAIALLLTFVPDNVWTAWKRQALLHLGPVAMHRARAFYLLNFLGAMIFLADRTGLVDWPGPLTAWGLLFVGGLLSMLWPVVRDLFSPVRSWQWDGVPVLAGTAPVWLYAVPLALLVFGFTSHLGLRTAGNMSMYSNLRTEAGQNNHILLGSNPFAFADYQNDVVHIRDIGDGATVDGVLDRWGALEGNLLPIIEFRKLMLRWRERGETVPMTVEYGDRVWTSHNIVEDPDWRVDEWDWEMRLMDFRVIQGDEDPNACRW